MPEGIEGGYQPTKEELKLGEEFLAQEHLESIELTEHEIIEKTWDGKDIKGIQHTDQHGRVVFRDEKYADGSEQAIQYKYYEDGRVDEQGTTHSKMLEGKEVGKELTREHPMTSHEVFVQWEDEDIGGFVSDTVQATLINLGQTRAGAATREPWSHFEVTDPAVLKIFAGFKRAPGKLYASQEGNLGRRFEIAVGGRQVVFENIEKIGVNFGTDGLPLKATFHSRSWSEEPAPEKLSTE